MKSFAVSISGMSLRGATLASKFLLLFLLARYLSPEEVGVYGLFVAAISILIFFLGAEIYIYNTRQIISGGASISRVIRNNLSLHTVTYALFLPLSFLLIPRVLPVAYVGWFIVLLFLEHQLREVQRLLIALGQPIRATIVMFLGAGFWPILCVLVFALRPELRGLSTVWLSWFLGSFAGVAAAVAFLTPHFSWSEFRAGTEWSWILRGLRSSVVPLCASVSFLGIVTLDRFALRHLGDGPSVGVYIFFFSLASAITALLDSGVVAASYPKIVRHFQNEDLASYRRCVQELAIKIVVGFFVLASFSAAAINPVLAVLGRDVYQRSIGVYWILLAFVFFWAVSLVPHYVLFARGEDLRIAIANFLGFLVSAAAFMYFIPANGPIGAASAILLGITVILLAKTMFSLNPAGRKERRK